MSKITLAVSPCSNPELTLEEALSAYQKLGYSRFELFTGWVKSAANPNDDPQRYLDLAAKYGFQYPSIHLPPLADDLVATVEAAAKTCRFGAALGCRAAIVKATNRMNYIAGGKRLLDAIEGLPITPVLTNHFGTAISSLEEYREVIEGIGDDRMKCLLEVGHFHSAGVLWKAGYELLKGRIALVHLKDQAGKQSVPFATGEIDLPGLIKRLCDDGYAGDIVIEMEVKDREMTLNYLRDARIYCEELLKAWS